MVGIGLVASVRSSSIAVANRSKCVEFLAFRMNMVIARANDIISATLSFVPMTSCKPKALLTNPSCLQTPKGTCVRPRNQPSPYKGLMATRKPQI